MKTPARKTRMAALGAAIASPFMYDIGPHFHAPALLLGIVAATLLVHAHIRTRDVPTALPSKEKP